MDSTVITSFNGTSKMAAATPLGQCGRGSSATKRPQRQKQMFDSAVWEYHVQGEVHLSRPIHRPGNYWRRLFIPSRDRDIMNLAEDPISQRQGAGH